MIQGLSLLAASLVGLYIVQKVVEFRRAVQSVQCVFRFPRGAHLRSTFGENSKFDAHDFSLIRTGTIQATARCSTHLDPSRTSFPASAG